MSDQQVVVPGTGLEPVGNRPTPASHNGNPDSETVSRASHEGWIYFVQSVDGGPVKIGFSRDPWARFRTLQVGFPVELRLLAIQEANPSQERDLHHRLAGYRERGEWFWPRGEVLLLMAFLFDRLPADLIVEPGAWRMWTHRRNS